MSEQKMYLYAFTQLPLITPKRFQRISSQFQQNLQAAWEYFPDWDIPFPPKHQKQLIEEYKQIDVEGSYEKLEKQQINIIAYSDPLFPYQLKQCPSPPFALFYKGILPHHHKRLVTIVGSRKMTAYGQQALQTLLPNLTSFDIGIVSGLAYGVDKYAHQLALQEQAYTLAVLPAGLDTITPRYHYQLAQSILEQNGCLLSEIPPGQKIHKGAFPRRNRILAALGEITLVIEAASKSGSKITAYQALDAGKDVAIIPGSIFSSQSQGCHDLLKQGATPICSSNDLLNLVNLSTNVTKKDSPSLSQEEQIITDLLVNLSREEVIEQSPYSAQQTMQILTNLEML